MTEQPKITRVHLVAGGFPRHSAAGHDIDYARLRLLEALRDQGETTASISPDFKDLAEWLPRADALITYVAGPFPDPDQCAELDQWLQDGGRWLALHGTSGGKAIPRTDGEPGREMVRLSHHDVLGCFFLNHPPIRSFQVDVTDPLHPITQGIDAPFNVMDELYLLEILDPENSQILLSTTSLPGDDPSAKKFGFHYAKDTSIEPDGQTRPLGYIRQRGRGAVVYLALGHCHTPATNIQPFVDRSVHPDGVTPKTFRGPWETKAFDQLLKNGLHWLTSTAPSEPRA
ncbi:MAG: ThuA domain-containing protein [Myxococcota bacterium]|nr:ThuA domain-containing protein [Myxococcota bacterium]